MSIIGQQIKKYRIENGFTQEQVGKIKVASLVTGIHKGQCSYKVYLAPPDGISYARDIAEKYGVTYSQLMKMTVERRS